MSYLKAYIGALIVFGAIDATWLSTMGPIVYRPALAEILAPNLRVAPAIAFYLMYPVGIVVFAITPALRSGSTASAFMLALLFGAIAYATYDLTNYAILRDLDVADHDTRYRLRGFDQRRCRDSRPSFGSLHHALTLFPFRPDRSEPIMAHAPFLAAGVTEQARRRQEEQPPAAHATAAHRAVDIA